MDPLASRFATDGNARFYAGEIIAAELELQDAQGTSEDLRGRSFVFSILTQRGEVLNSLLATISEDGTFCGWTFDGSATAALPVSVLRYQIVEVLADGIDTLADGALRMLAAVAPIAAGSAPLPDSGPVTRFLLQRSGGGASRLVITQRGARGLTPVLSIGAVETLPPGSDATAAIDVSDPSAPALSLALPRGDAGDPGPQGDSAAKVLADAGTIVEATPQALTDWLRAQAEAANTAALAELSATVSALLAASPPLMQSAPAVEGAAIEGETLTASGGAFFGAVEQSTWQWTRNGADIVGATAATYTLGTADRRALIAVRRIATNANGSNAAPSAPVGKVLPALPLAVGAKIMYLGDSYVQRGGYSKRSGSTLQGASLLARGSISHLQALDPRWNMDVFATRNHPNQDIASDNSVDGAAQGQAGSRIDYAYASNVGMIRRFNEYAAARDPDIVVIVTPGGNNVNDGDSGETVVALLEQLVRDVNAAGAWAVLRTLGTWISWIGTSKADACNTVNDWILAQAQRPGVRVIDTREIDGPNPTVEVPQVIANAAASAGFANAILQDGVHPGPYGASLLATRKELPLLRTMVSPGARYGLDPLAAENLFPQKGLPGTGGVKQTGVTGDVADGILIRRATTTTSLIACAKEVISEGNEKQVITITPVDNGDGTYQSAQINLCWPGSGSSSSFSLSSFGIEADEWLEVLVPVELSETGGWYANGNTGTGAIRLELPGYNGSTFKWEANTSVVATDGGLFYLRSLFRRDALQDPTSVRTGYSSGVSGVYLLQLNYSGNVAGGQPGVAKVHSPIFRKIDDPRAAWGLA